MRGGKVYRANPKLSEDILRFFDSDELQPSIDLLPVNCGLCDFENSDFCIVHSNKFLIFQ